MIGAIAKVATEVAKGAEVVEKAEKVGKISEAGKTIIDISKRVDVATVKSVEIKKTGVDISKRVKVKEKVQEGLDKAKELTQEQKKKLADSGMSQYNVDNCTYQDGVYKLKTLNEHLENKTHPETGVEYVRKVIDLAGKKVEGVFPEFNSYFTVQLPKDKIIAKDKVQFSECNTQLKNAIAKDPKLREKFSKRQLEQIWNGDNPGGYTWHHNEEVGKMELVDSKIHAASKHTGGKTIWGGGR